MKNIEYLIFKNNVYVGKCYSFDELNKLCDHFKNDDSSTNDFIIYVFNDKSDHIKSFKYIDGYIIEDFIDEFN